METEMFVNLVIPDNVCITAKNALNKLGYDGFDLTRSDYYKISSETDLSSELVSVDLLVNTNKHTVALTSPTQGVCVLVKDLWESEKLADTIRSLGVAITSITKGVVWNFTNCSKKDAVNMVEELLYNQHFQEYIVLE